MAHEGAAKERAARGAGSGARGRGEGKSGAWRRGERACESTAVAHEGAEENLEMAIFFSI